jgi:hypothetical protein
MVVEEGLASPSLGLNYGRAMIQGVSEQIHNFDGVAKHSCTIILSKMRFIEKGRKAPILTITTYVALF